MSVDKMVNPRFGFLLLRVVSSDSSTDRFFAADEPVGVLSMNIAAIHAVRAMPTCWGHRGRHCGLGVVSVGMMQKLVSRTKQQVL